MVQVATLLGAQHYKASKVYVRSKIEGNNTPPPTKNINSILALFFNSKLAFLNSILAFSTRNSLFHFLTRYSLFHFLTRYSLFLTRYSLFITRNSLFHFLTRYSLFLTRYSLFFHFLNPAFHNSLFITRNSLLLTRNSLLITRNSIL